MTNLICPTNIYDLENFEIRHNCPLIATIVQPSEGILYVATPSLFVPRRRDRQVEGRKPIKGAPQDVSTANALDLLQRNVFPIRPSEKIEEFYNPRSGVDRPECPMLSTVF